MKLQLAAFLLMSVIDNRFSPFLYAVVNYLSVLFPAIDSSYNVAFQCLCTMNSVDEFSKNLLHNWIFEGSSFNYSNLVDLLSIFIQLITIFKNIGRRSYKTLAFIVMLVIYTLGMDGAIGTTVTISK